MIFTQPEYIFINKCQTRQPREKLPACRLSFNCPTETYKKVSNLYMNR